ncbi:phosphatase PAP2 family protein [Intestinibacter bartlettii]|uniref:Phosphatase PAP2 family protein n=1 Tax=Intestinibacter bartlettii TaxID=261299 RepID=A0ABS6DWQ4_9FIRM|nr:phosphatase PAP2 family protein [Intestinibacter bartlettii]MBU5335999.1 phosphatase PAP2 family protein [Intestinibacter bartlettii]
MKKENKKNLYVSGGLFLLFIVWTVVIYFVDVQKVGPKESAVGVATFNVFFHNLTGVHMIIYNITDWLGVVAFLIVLGFAILGAVQLIQRKSLFKVDYDILVLGGFYILVMVAYVLFEIFAINYRPILINGCLEASYPSSTTLLVMCVIPTAIMQFHKRIKNNNVRNVVITILSVFMTFMVIGRLVAGVHWFTDIIGGALLSASLVMLYYSVNKIVEKDNL